MMKRERLAEKSLAACSRSAAADTREKLIERYGLCKQNFADSWAGRGAEGNHVEIQDADRNQRSGQVKRLENRLHKR